MFLKRILIVLILGLTWILQAEARRKLNFTVRIKRFQASPGVGYQTYTKSDRVLKNVSNILMHAIQLLLAIGLSLMYDTTTTTGLAARAYLLGYFFFVLRILIMN